MDGTTVSPDNQEIVTVPPEIAAPLGMILDAPVQQLTHSLDVVNNEIKDDPHTTKRIAKIRSSLEPIRSVTHALQDPAHNAVQIRPFAGGKEMVPLITEQEVEPSQLSEVIVDEALTEDIQEAVQHTVGNPLSALQGNVSYYLLKNPSKTVQKESEAMIDSSRQLVEIIDILNSADRLKFVRNKKGKLQIIPLRDPQQKAA